MQCAEDVIGFRKPKNKGYHSNDPDVKAFVAERHTLRHNLLSSNQASDDTSLRYKINSLGRMIRKKLKELQIGEADQLALEIKSTDDSRQMFEAVRSLAQAKESKPIVLHNDAGHPVGTDKEKAALLRDWYETNYQV